MVSLPNPEQIRLSPETQLTLLQEPRCLEKWPVILEMSFPNGLCFSSKLGCKWKIIQSRFQNYHGILAAPMCIIIINKKTQTKKIFLGRKMQEMTRNAFHSICYGQNWPKRRKNLKTDLESQDASVSTRTLTKSVIFHMWKIAKLTFFRREKTTR